MGIFSELFKSRDKPQDRTAGSNYAFFFGSTTSGKAVTERSAMQMTAVYSCVRILSEAVAGIHFADYDQQKPGPLLRGYRRNGSVLCRNQSALRR